MSNDKKTKNKNDEKWLVDAQASEAPAASKIQQDLPQKEASMMAKFAFLFSLAAVTASGLLYLDLYQQKQTLAKEQQDYQERAAKMERLQQQQAQDLSQIMRKSPAQWIGSEVLYMLRIADRKLWLEQDRATALSLMKETRMLIGQVQEPRFVGVFDAITQDIEHVEKLDSAEMRSAHLQLDGFEQKIEQLPILIYSHMSEMKVESTLSDDASWQENLSHQWRNLIQDVISVRRHPTNNPVFLLPEQVWYLRENMRRKLLTAQLALYRQDMTAYHTSIALLTGWVKKYADLQQERAREALNELMMLEVLQIPSREYHPLQSIAELEKAMDPRLRSDKE